MTPSSRATARLAGQPLTRSFTALTAQVRQTGLLARHRTFYALVFGGLLLCLGGIATGIVLLGESWLQLLMAGALGLVLTQFAFLGHEASHRQIFTSGPANDRSGRILAVGFAGISYSWWMTKHTRRHGNPNRVGKDPDVARDTISFVPEDAAAQHGVMGWVTRRQAWLFFPLLLLEGVNLHARSVRSLLQRGPVAGRALELTMLGLRFGLYAGLLFWISSLGMAAAFRCASTAAPSTSPTPRPTSCLPTARPSPTSTASASPPAIPSTGPPLARYAPDLPCTSC